MKQFIARHLRAMAVVPALVLGLGFAGAGLVPSGIASAADCKKGDTECIKNAECATMTLAQGAKCAKTSEQSTNLFGGDNSIFQKVSSVMIFLVGSIAVIMLIFGGIRYVISGGNQDQVKGAKNTILYSVVGIIVAIIAYAVVNFVIKSFAV